MPTRQQVREVAWFAALGSSEVGAEWHQVLVDLEAVDALPGESRNHFEISVNYTGLDTFAIEIEAAGQDLLRKHGVDPP